MKFTFNADLKDAGLSLRVNNSLMRAGIKGVSALRKRVLGPDDMSLCEVRNFGTQSLDEVLDFLYPDRLGMVYKVCLSDKGEALADLIEDDYIDGTEGGIECELWRTLGDVLMELNGAGKEVFWWPHIHVLSAARVVDIVSLFMSTRGYDSHAERVETSKYAYALLANDYIALEPVEESHVCKCSRLGDFVENEHGKE